MLGAYYYTGMRAESELRTEIGQLNMLIEQQATPGSTLSFSLDNYSRGLFSSKANLTLNMKVELPASTKRPAMRMPKLSYAIQLAIHHGPFIFSSQKLGLAQVTAMVGVPDKMQGMAKMLLTENSKLPKLVMNLYLGFQGDGQMRLQVPAFEVYARGQQGELIWKGLDANYHISHDIKELHGSTVFKGFEFKNLQAEGVMGETKADYKLSYSPFGVWLGHMSFHLPSFDIMVNGQKMVSLSSFKMSSKASVNAKNLLETDLTSSLAQLMVMGQTYGPANLLLEFNGLDATIFKTLQDKIERLNNPVLSKEERQQKLMKLMPLASELVNKGAVLALRELKVKLPQGLLEANAEVTIDKGVKVTSPVELAAHVVAKAHLSIPKELLTKLLTQKARKAIVMQQMEKRLSQANSMPSDNDKPTTSISTDNEHQQDDSTADSSTQDAHTPLTSDQIDEMASQKVKNQISKWLESKVLIEEGSVYKVDVMFNKGILEVNGNKFSKEMLKQ